MHIRRDLDADEELSSMTTNAQIFSNLNYEWKVNLPFSKFKHRSSQFDYEPNRSIFFFEFPFFVSNLRYYDIPPRRPDIPIS